MECEHCKRPNPDNSKYCNACGERIGTFPVEVPPSGTTIHSGEPTRVNKCFRCGTSNPTAARFCSGCGSALSPQTITHYRPCPICGTQVSIFDPRCPGCEERSATAPSLAPSRATQTQKPVIAGILMVTNSLLAFIATWWVLSSPETFFGTVVVEGLLEFCAGVNMLLAVGTLVGSCFAFTRTHFTLAMACAVMSLLCGAFYIGILFGIVNIVLIAFSRDEFSD